MSKTYAIIVAAGKGLRMRTDMPKQYLPLHGVAVLARTVQIFDSCPQIDEILLVIPPGDQDFCRTNILNSIQTEKIIQLVAGGPERQESVFNALKMIRDKDALVAIHDGVRPLVAVDLITASIKAADRSGACIVALPVSDTVKRVDRDGCIQKTIDRDGLWFAQTPQVFRYEIIMAAHLRAQEDHFNGSDDALLLERMGTAVEVVEGHKNNIKITTPEDILLAEYLLTCTNANTAYPK